MEAHDLEQYPNRARCWESVRTLEAEVAGLEAEIAGVEAELRAAAQH